MCDLPMAIAAAESLVDFRFASRGRQNRVRVNLIGFQVVQVRQKSIRMKP